MNATDYIQHHMKHLVLKLGATSFWNLHLDTLVISIFVAIAINIVISQVLRTSSWDKLTDGQNLLEMYYEAIENMVLKSYKQTNLILISTIFSMIAWICAMNLMDLLPASIVSFFSNITNTSLTFHLIPTEDLNTSLALGIATFLLITFFSIKDKGLFKHLKHICVDPFGIYAFPINVFLYIVEVFTRVLSLTLRLFGNMFAGGLIFVIVAAFPNPIAQFCIAFIWSILHCPILFIQAMLFGNLTLAYITPQEVKSPSKINTL